ncbi:hypothetical protein NLJ89_g9109 [Agrocybe chaxingu]|uniref:Uncharacterized protein n=1 Tax=Agrocybe chaxingu TaxID=84603 RepID=A0A9W8MTV1_9AGAR|nr:hypothetical protein NLJ89_g9109 [Agrocybe chaxingu]
MNDDLPSPRPTTSLPLYPTPNARLLPSNAVPDDGSVPSATCGHEKLVCGRVLSAIAFVNDEVGSAAAPLQESAPPPSFINQPPNMNPIAERHRLGRLEGGWTAA